MEEMIAITGLAEAGRRLLHTTSLTPAERRRCLGKWFAGAHEHAARAAFCLDAHRDLLAAVLPYDAAAITAQRQRVLVLERAQHEIASLEKDIDDTLLYERARLYQMSAGVVRGLSWVAERPFQSDAVRLSVAGSLRSLRKEREQRNGKIRHTKRLRRAAVQKISVGKLSSPAHEKELAEDARSRAEVDIRLAAKETLIEMEREGRHHGQGQEPYGRGALAAPARAREHAAAARGAGRAQRGGTAGGGAGADDARLAQQGRVGGVPSGGPDLRDAAARGRGDVVPGGRRVRGAGGDPEGGARGPLPGEPVHGQGHEEAAPAHARARAGARRRAGVRDGGGLHAQGGARGPHGPLRHARGGARSHDQAPDARYAHAGGDGARGGVPAQGVARAGGEDAGREAAERAPARGALVRARAGPGERPDAGVHGG